MLVTSLFVFAFQLGDGDIVFVDKSGVDHVIQSEKMLGTETHSLSRIEAWKNSVSVVRRIDSSISLPNAFILSTDGFANSFKNDNEFNITCKDYFEAIDEHGSDCIEANLKSWLSETSNMGCGDDITVLISYSFDDGALANGKVSIRPLNSDDYHDEVI